MGILSDPAPSVHPDGRADRRHSDPAVETFAALVEARKRFDRKESLRLQRQMKVLGGAIVAVAPKPAGGGR